MSRASEKTRLWLPQHWPMWIGLAAFRLANRLPWSCATRPRPPPRLVRLLRRSRPPPRRAGQPSPLFSRKIPRRDPRPRSRPLPLSRAGPVRNLRRLVVQLRRTSPAHHRRCRTSRPRDRRGPRGDSSDRPLHDARDLRAHDERALRPQRALPRSQQSGHRRRNARASSKPPSILTISRASSAPSATATPSGMRPTRANARNKAKSFLSSASPPSPTPPRANSPK